MTEPEIQRAATGPVDDEGEHDDGQDDQHNPNEKPYDAGNFPPGYGSGSCHGSRLPAFTRFIQSGPLFNICVITSLRSVGGAAANVIRVPDLVTVEQTARSLGEPPDAHETPAAGRRSRTKMR